MTLTQFFTEVRQRLERANPEKKIFTDYADNRNDLETALAIIEKLNAALRFYAAPENWSAVTIQDRAQLTKDDLELIEPTEDYYGHKGGSRARQAQADVQKMLGEKK